MLTYVLILKVIKMQTKFNRIWNLHMADYCQYSLIPCINMSNATTCYCDKKIVLVAKEQCQLVSVTILMFTGTFNIGLHVMS